jgi:carbon monoxide dehydrogenase subunit G
MTQPDDSRQTDESAGDAASRADPDPEFAEAGEPASELDREGESRQEPDEDADTDRLEFSDAVRIEADRAELWATISDPETLTKCVPGAESIERTSERTYSLEITRGVSHLTVSLTGEAEFVEMNPPDYVVTTGDAFDRKTGSQFDILAAMEIQETDDGAAELVYQAEVEISGGVASITDRLLRPVVERDIATYFDNVRAEIEAGAA